MELQTISQVSKHFSISTRTLRYYEQIGLITPMKKGEFAYRTYDTEAIKRLRQIIILRKLRIPLKQIAEVLQSADTRVAIESFERNLADIEEEITALSTIRSVIKAFIEQLNLGGAKFALPDDEGLLEVVDSLTVSKINFKEEKSMEQLNQANDKLNKLSDVRIIYLPPMTVAAASATGEGCEGKAADMINRFVLERNLQNIKPDIRHFGFDCSAGKTGVGENSHKYQMWVTIPDDMDVSEPLVKRTFTGGFYAAHMIKMGDFDHWMLLRDWVSENEQYENDWNTVRCSPHEDDMDRCMEEQLNYWGNLQNFNFKHENMQLDLLFPIKKKKKTQLKKNLSDVCNYMKAIIIPDIPDDFVVAEPFRHGITDDKIRKGIGAFREFLYKLYDKLAKDKDKIDVETGRDFDPNLGEVSSYKNYMGAIYKCFPVMNDISVILFNLGYHGKLEKSKLILTGKSLLMPFGKSNEKYNSLINMTSERKLELFTILSELGFKFEGADFTKEVDFSKIDTFNVRYESDNSLPVGLKLLAEAQTAKKSDYYNLKSVFMRCDFYPLAIKTVKVKKLNFNSFLSPHPPEIKDWIVSIDKFLTDNGCKVNCEFNDFSASIIFTYILRKNNEKVCKIYMGIEGCMAMPYGHHFANKDNILTYLPESMLDTMSNNKKCSGCASKNPNGVVHAVRFKHKEINHIKCHHFGFGFPLDKASERKLIEKWLELELAWS